MDDFARESPDFRRIAFVETAARRGLSSPVLAEKDFWVCWLLLRLSGLLHVCPMVFKGGTSLSKGYGLLNRFSEDVDIVLDAAALGFGGAQHPRAAQGNERKRRIERLGAAAIQVVLEQIRPHLAGNAAPIGGAIAADEDDGQTLLFTYPRAFADADYGAIAYVAPSVRLEFGARGEADPFEERSIMPMIAEELPAVIRNASVSFPTLLPERTFWEKAFTLHKYALGGHGKTPASFSRHYADVARLRGSGVAANAIAQPSLRQRVKTMNEVMFPAAWARFDLAVPGTFRLLPDDTTALAADYRRMAPMFMGEPEPLDAIVEELRALEREINGR